MGEFSDSMNSVLGSAQYIQNAFDQGAERKKKNSLAALASQYYAGGQKADPQLLSQIAANGGDAGGFQKQSYGNQDRQREQLGQIAALLVKAPPAMRPQIWESQVKPGLIAMGLPAHGPYSAEYDQLAEQLAAQYAGGSSSGNNVQSTYVDAQGNRVAIMRNGAHQIVGQNAPNNQIIAADGGYFGVNKGSLNAAPVIIGGAPQAPQTAPPPGNNDAILAQANFMVQNGVPEDKVQAWLAQQPGIMPASNTEQAPPAPTRQQLQPIPKAPPKAAGPTDLERRIALARQMGASEAQIKAMVVGGGQAGNAQTVKTSQATAAKLAQFSTVQRQIDRLEKAAQSVAGNAVFDGGPMDQYAIKYTPQGQELEQAGAAIMPVLTALTRVPGVGSQSDLEARLAALQLPSAALPPEVNKRAVESLRAYMADLKAAYENQGKPQQPASASSGWSIQAIP